ncbi:MAG: 16S rRNA (guanine(527)-N(7))-methyltransferase RsmG [Clostridiales bacterium]|nr:16S rRNA (guanine(527)-N(7))-methyltransferase RsmG [Clostridiales bacterium]
MNAELLAQYALDTGAELDKTALERFGKLEKMLLQRNKEINLTAITDSDGILIKHFIDSLYVMKGLEIPQGAKCIDVGCGAGFPALPLLIARNDLSVTFLDSTNKKLNFVKEAVNALGLNAAVMHARAEELAHDNDYREKFDIAFSRALAEQRAAAEYCMPFVRVGGVYISMKANEQEIKDAAGAIKTLGGEIQSIVSLKLPNGDPRCIAYIKKISQCMTKYPRKAKKISSEPI